MSDFIIVHRDGQEHIVNLAWVQEIIDENGKATIYFAYDIPDAADQDYIKTDDMYSHVKDMLRMAIMGC